MLEVCHNSQNLDHGPSYDSHSAGWHDSLLARRTQFRERGYSLVPQLVAAELLDSLEAYAYEAVVDGRMTRRDSTNAPSVYGDMRTEDLLLQLRPRIEAESGTLLYPTYSYFRVYEHGSVLERHLDRESCEISVTLSIGLKPSAPWPFWIERNGDRVCIKMMPGEATLYRGVDTYHWREPFEGETAVQAFLHYVQRTGPFSSFRLDKREKLSLLAR